MCSALELRHDYEAVSENRSDGVFDVLLCNSFCNLDSIMIKNLISEITPKITQVLSHKESYKKIAYYASTEYHIDETMSRLSCSTLVRISLNNPDSIVFDKNYLFAK